MLKITNILISQRKELEETKRQNYVERDTEIKNIDSNIIKVIIGPRRAGKSFFAVHHLKDRNFGYVNFDDEELIQVKNYDEIVDSIMQIYKNPKTLFLDEIQNLPRWELLTNRLQRQGFNLIITGSNSNLLSKELATHLTGRHLPTVIFPLSFKEFLSLYGNNLTETEQRSRFNEYLEIGGFPEPIIKNIDHNSYIKTLYDSVILKDIILRYNIKFAKSIEDLARHLISNFGNPISYTQLTKISRVKSVHTVMKYVKYLEEAFVIFELNQFSFKTKTQVKSNKKIYCFDNGIISSKAFVSSPNFGKLYENIVAIELKKKEMKGEIDFYYWKNIQQEEVDFAVKEGLKITSLIQVCFDVSDIKTKDREVRALLKAGDELKCKNLIILTENYEAEKNEEWFGSKGKIKYIPLWKWMLGNKSM